VNRGCEGTVTRSERRPKQRKRKKYDRLVTRAERRPEREIPDVKTKPREGKNKLEKESAEKSVKKPQNRKLGAREQGGGGRLWRNCRDRRRNCSVISTVMCLPKKEKLRKE